MLEVYLSPKAIDDLEEIYVYTLNTWSLSQAEKYQDELYLAMIALCRNPKRGKPYPYKEEEIYATKKFT